MLENSVILTQDETIQYMSILALTNGLGYTTEFPPEREDIVNKATPTFYGGAIVNYSLLNKRLNILANSYFYTKQEFYSKYTHKSTITEEYIADVVDPKIILNLNVSYSFSEGISANLNARNILGTKQEFSYMDKIGNMVMLGLVFKL
jgi:outer membrane receptor protein involved in Fe transport